MKVQIHTDVEAPSETVLYFPGDDLWERYNQAKHAEEIPDDVAQRWKAARNAWFAVQQEAEEYMTRKYGKRPLWSRRLPA